jgi:ABC-2 type transport system ATP-binding protein
LIEVRGLVKRYGEKTALDGIDFTVKSGEVVGLLGLNGAGKSTTMNIITGFLSPTAGSVSVDGYDIIREPLKAKAITGYLPEQLAFYPDMRVREYLDFICDLKGYDKRKSRRGEHLSQICEKVGISDVGGRMIRNLSKGYRQRVSFAQALVGNPKVLILDEPTVGLDPSQIREIRKLIRELGVTSTVILSSHILTEIQEICARVIVLHEGKVVASGAPDALSGVPAAHDRMTVRVRGAADGIKSALLSVPGVTDALALPLREDGACDFSVTGKSGLDIRADVFRALARADLPLLQASGGELTLEDIFLRLVSAGETGGIRA